MSQILFYASSKPRKRYCCQVRETASSSRPFGIGVRTLNSNDVSNVMRVIILILASEYFGVNATSEGILHHGSGIMVFMLAMFLFYMTGRLVGAEYGA